jgi:hypothetical protein
VTPKEEDVDFDGSEPKFSSKKKGPSQEKPAKKYMNKQLFTIKQKLTRGFFQNWRKTWSETQQPSRS